MLVCVGSTLIMLVSAFGFVDVSDQKNVVLDPSRVAAQVVSGIGFLGAGSILLRGEIVRGLTTAASFWSVAGIDLAVGGGMYIASVGATIIILVILAGVKPIERKFISVKQQRSIQLLGEHGTVTFESLYMALGMGTVRIKQFVLQQSEDDPELDEIHIALSRVSDGDFAAVCMRLAELSGVPECRRGKQGNGTLIRARR
ncbi:Protein MgtC (plasmid) [Caballeronia sp. S22]